MTGAGAQAHARRCPEAGAGGGAELALPAAIELLAAGGGKRKPAQGTRVECRVARAARAMVAAEVGARDRIAVPLRPIAERGRARDGLAPPQRRLPAFAGVAVGEHLGPVAVEHEEVGVAAEREGRFRALAEFLP